MKKVPLFILSVCLAFEVLANLEAPKVQLARIFITAQGDSLPHFILRPVYCFAEPKFKLEKHRRNYYKKYARMIYNLKKVYPYAQIAKRKLAEMDAEFAKIQSPKEKKAYIKKVEKEMFKEFEPIIRKMSVSQGRILIKLIDRETGRTGYQIVREFKGGFSAFFWQSIAVLFDASLKTPFDASGNDKMLNRLIILHENGLL
ncbi:MAG: DUF4294 domain-containing protein [Bacteroidales bacterium]